MSAPRFDTLADWLSWQEQLHPTEIELGLTRVRRVAERAGLRHPTMPIITVSGTNGKGSVVAYVSTILKEAGYKVGFFTSPHLFRYNERIRVDGEEATDEEICTAFHYLDQARGNDTITYFEYGALAAMYVFTQREVDVVVLEVGLGGRLDATNLWDASVAAITSIGIDHVEWLGDTREKIAIEKAGVSRPGRPLICGDMDPPETLLAFAQETGCQLRLRGQDFDSRVDGDTSTWSFSSPEMMLPTLPMPALIGAHQLDNATTALAVLAELDFIISAKAIRQGLINVAVKGRLQRLEIDGVAHIFDVGHNPHAAHQQVAALTQFPCHGETHAVCGFMGDKDIETVIAILSPVIAHWHLVPLPPPRGLDQQQVYERVSQVVSCDCITAHASLQEGMQAAQKNATSDDRVLVFGSFVTVGALLPE